jgi:hypothetical protein
MDFRKKDKQVRSNKDNLIIGRFVARDRYSGDEIIDVRNISAKNALPGILDVVVRKYGYTLDILPKKDEKQKLERR